MCLLNLQDFQNALNTPDITKLTYLGHASTEHLYLSQGNAFSISDLPNLNRSNFAQDAEIEFSGCKTAEGAGSITQEFANYFNRNTYGWETGLFFGYYIPGFENLGVLYPSVPCNQGSLTGSKGNAFNATKTFSGYEGLPWEINLLFKIGSRKVGPLEVGLRKACVLEVGLFRWYITTHPSRTCQALHS